MTPSPPPRFHVLFLFGCTIFLSSFLLFLIQPIFAKLILPWFGGSAAVWTTCLVFFQVVLLFGYTYSHVVSTRLPFRVQALLHGVLLLAATTLLPVIPSATWKPGSGDNPAARILLMLTVVLGLPYFLLSATAPLLQSWFAARWPEARTYRLFALSNAGALIALCGYPVLIEPKLSTQVQDIAWSAGFAAFSALCVLTSVLAIWPLRQARTRTSEDLGDAPSLLDRVTWIALAAGGSMLLLATTNQLTQNVAAVPFLWILPLVVYLLTFILCFESSRWYKPQIFLRLLAVALASVGYAIYDIQESTPIPIAVPVLIGGLFIVCMYCHGELSFRKPAPSRLTGFYLMIALGGAIGAVFVGLIAPAIFDGIYELPVSMLFVGGLALALNWQSGWAQRALWAAVTVTMAMVLVAEVRGYHHDAVVMTRNFYGSLRVVETPAMRTLYHGTIEHGSEQRSAAQRMKPTSYYGPDSGVGLTLRNWKGPKKVGIVGLGAGTLSAYGQPGDQYHFYEINPKVIELAKSQFSYLGGTHAQLDMTLGDARFSLEHQKGQGFDVLVVDAFSGDAIPVHLLTREAFGIYFRQLKPDGVLAIHVSNQYLDLAPVVQQLASQANYSAVEIHSAKNEQQFVAAATWVLVTRNREFLSLPEIANASQPIPPRPDLRLWTDDYNNLFQVIRW